ncbi:response regulator transcription factor [Sulfurospirillum sp. 1612]|uniref:response regulator transcription factor n=1 Tax=Sulfurospirillum sp. 1612 TaxID=3094835 RepID=UPI002F9205A3
MSAQIIIIEDEEDLLELLEYHLSKAGFRVVGFLSTKKVEDFLLEESADLMIVDRNLPGVEGSEFVKYLRKNGYKIPAIFVSAKDSDKEIEEGFLRGGDDYVTKPYNINELILRIKAILRRTKSYVESGKLAYKDIVLDIDKREVFVAEELVALSKLEFDLLLYFINNKNIVLDRNRLLEDVWRDTYLKQDKTVNVTVNRLKNRIDKENKKGYINAIRGVGYKFC